MITPEEQHHEENEIGSRQGNDYTPANRNSPGSTVAPGGTYLLNNREIARVGYGAMQLRNSEAEPDKAVAILQRAIDLGVDHIDTAHFYGNGFVNSLIRKVLKPDNKIVVASKIGADPNPQGKIPIKIAQRPEQLRASVEDNLVSLGLEHIPLVYLRRLDAGPGITPEGDQVVDIDDQLAVMIALRNEGKIGAIGLSGVTLAMFNRALPAGIAAVQNSYSLISREFENMLDVCLEKKIAWVPFSPLGGAAAGSPKVTDQQKVIDIAKRLNLTPSQVGLAWLLQHDENMLLIPGTANIEHLEQNITAGSVVLDAEALTNLNALAGL